MKYILAISLLIMSFSANAQFTIPDVNKTVNDYSGVISQEDKDSIDRVIRDYYAKSTNQLGVLVVPTLNGEDISEVAVKVFEKWKLGSKEKNNGILILYAINDKKTRVEIGYGLEGDLTDVESKQIQAAVKHHLKSGNYGKAILEQVIMIRDTIEKKNVPVQVPKSYPSATSQSIGGDNTVGTTISGPEPLTVFSAIGCVLLFIMIIASTNAHMNRKEQIPLVEKEITDRINKNKKDKEDSEKKEKLAKEIRAKYNSSPHKKEDELQEQVRRESSRLDSKNSEIRELKEIAHKYGVDV